MKRTPLVTGFFVLVLLFLIGSGLVAPGDPVPDTTGMQAAERYPQEAHLMYYREHLTRLEADPGHCR